MDEGKKGGEDIVLLGVNIACMPRSSQLLFLGGLMMVFQVGHGVLTEYVATGVLAGMMWASAAAELIVYALFSAAELGCSGKPRFQNVPWASYSVISILIALGRGLTWVGYGTLSFPTVLLFKSSKLVAVMVGGALYLRNRFKPLEYLAALLIVLGLYVFASGPMTPSVDRGAEVSDADFKAQGFGFQYSHRAIGMFGVTEADRGTSMQSVFIMVVAILSEAIVGVLQESALQRQHRPLAELFFITNAIGAVFLTFVSAASGELTLVSKRLSEEPTAVLWLVSAVSLAYGGTYAFTAAIQGFGAVVATGLGICRKFVSVCFSFLLFPKPFRFQQAIGVAVFFTGLTVGWVQDSARQWKQKREGHRIDDVQDVLEGQPLVQLEPPKRESSQTGIHPLSPKLSLSEGHG
eukprot:CAMPEP_0180121486 /NCGR_PEP_ID=MMETSP0986-20121125/3072_1 /TAXON_ID=697907 /ORGANISM="non described non described, Strain CCMP2293" /LENGTH=406 /DNA_ID=CAMNT_0022060619 /DNA_START=159 /DNA_END=1379 /DNA_ORIENTATION=+